MFAHPDPHYLGAENKCYNSAVIRQDHLQHRQKKKQRSKTELQHTFLFAAHFSTFTTSFSFSTFQFSVLLLFYAHLCVYVYVCIIWYATLSAYCAAQNDLYIYITYNINVALLYSQRRINIFRHLQSKKRIARKTLVQIFLFYKNIVRNMNKTMYTSKKNKTEKSSSLPCDYYARWSGLAKYEEN